MHFVLSSFQLFFSLWMLIEILKAKAGREGGKELLWAFSNKITKNILGTIYLSR
jgi:hypothetical protein